MKQKHSACSVTLHHTRVLKQLNDCSSSLCACSTWTPLPISSRSWRNGWMPASSTSCECAVLSGAACRHVQVMRVDHELCSSCLQEQQTATVIQSTLQALAHKRTQGVRQEGAGRRGSEPRPGHDQGPRQVTVWHPDWLCHGRHDLLLQRC